MPLMIMSTVARATTECRQVTLLRRRLQIAQHLDDVCGDAGLFGDDEGLFCHGRVCGPGWLLIVDHRGSCSPDEMKLE